VRYDKLYTAYAESAKVHELFVTAFDETLPAEVEPFSFVPAEGMRLLASRLALADGDRLLDLACGRGGPGMWIARETGASLVGVDPSSIAVEHASGRRAMFGLEERASFTVGEFGALAAAGIADESVDGVLCIDSIQFAPDLQATLADILRVLRPEGRLAVTCWEGSIKFPERLGERFAAAGFGGVQVTEHPEWLECQRALHRGALAVDPGEIGDGDIGLQNLRMEAEVALPMLDRLRRVLVSGRRPGQGQGPGHAER
jgi:SAM-dependent methyltransferase